MELYICVLWCYERIFEIILFQYKIMKYENYLINISLIDNFKYSLGSDKGALDLSIDQPAESHDKKSLWPHYDK